MKITCWSWAHSVFTFEVILANPDNDNNAEDVFVILYKKLCYPIISVQYSYASKS